MHSLSPYDALLLVSYGGPNGPEDVLPFLRNATGGAGIPDSRLEQVGGHYRLFGGVSPINARNDELLAGLHQRLGDDLIYTVGNRNWHPYFSESLIDLVDRGARRILTLFTTAYTCYSGCRQYRENLAQALADLRAARPEVAGEVTLDRVRPFANTPGFVTANARAIAAAARDLNVAPASDHSAATSPSPVHLVYVTHSITLEMARHSGSCRCAHSATEASPAVRKPALFDDRFDTPVSRPSVALRKRLTDFSPEALNALPTVTREQDALGQGWTYLAQHLAIAQAINRRLAAQGLEMPWSLAFCSRSGSPHQAWLEPDINDHLRDLAASGVRRVIVAPFGFISDHMEVVYDLDTEAAATAQELGLEYRRAATAESDPEFLDELADLVYERAAFARGEHPKQSVEPDTYPPLAETCGPNCCQYPRPIHSHPHHTVNPTPIKGETMGHPESVQTAPEITGDPRDYAVDYHEVNARENYSLHMVFRRTRPLPTDPQRLERITHRLEEAVNGVVVRGWYDVSGFRPDADLMIWALADNTEALQEAFRKVGAIGTCHGRPALFEPVWSAMSRHLPAEFNESHLPACWGGFAPRKYAAVYPFVRSWDWYYLPKARRNAILKEHGMNGHDYNDVAVSTLAAFALGDWEWTITLEADRLDRVMGVLRKQREVEARLFVRVDTPFFTGVRVEPREWVDLQPKRDDASCQCGQSEEPSCGCGQ